MAGHINVLLDAQDIPTEPTKMKIDPITAAAWLELNKRNRARRPEAVAALARDMLNGDWKYTGDAIKFDTDGNLSDGQHRLAAVVKSGMTVEMMVIPNLDPSAQAVMDTGTRRTAADALTIEGTSNAYLLAAVARLAIKKEKGALTAKGEQVTVSEIRAWLEANEDVHDAVRWSHQLASIPKLTGTVKAYTLMVLRRINREQADQFFTDLATYNTSGKGDPRSALLHRLNMAHANRETMSVPAQISGVYRAWNAMRAGRELFRVQVTARGGVVEIPDPC